MSDVYQSLAHSKWDCKYHVVFVPKRNRLGSDKRLTLHPLLVGFHQATWRGFYTRKDSRNGQTFSSLTGRTSGLPISVITRAIPVRWRNTVMIEMGKEDCP